MDWGDIISVGDDMTCADARTELAQIADKVADRTKILRDIRPFTFTEGIDNQTSIDSDALLFSPVAVCNSVVPIRINLSFSARVFYGEHLPE